MAAGSVHPSRSPSPLLSWSQEQLVRLEWEWRKLQRSYAYHPYIRVAPVQSDPPAEYDIEFHVKTVCVSDSGELEYLDVVPMRVWLPQGFPYVSPAAKPLKAIFHPNASYEGIHLSSGWAPTNTLVDFVRRLGELLAWRTYDPESVVNQPAVDWMEANAGTLPTDASADFAPDAGGEPLDRIYQNGAATIEKTRQELERVRDSLLELDGAPGITEIRDFSRRIEQELNLFLDSEVPDPLRGQATALEEWALALPGTIPAWDALRQQRAAAQAVRSANAALVAKREPIIKQMKAVEALSPRQEPTNPRMAMAAIPSRKAMELVLLKFPALLRESEDLLAALHERVKELDIASPTILQDETTPLGRQLHEETVAQAAAIQAARDLATQTLSSMDPLMEQARVEAAAIRQIGAWREYLDLFTTGSVLEKRMAELGAAGVHAFFIENSSGSFGPFQYDEPVDMGKSRVAVRSTNRNRVRLIDVPTTAVLGKSETGVLTIDLGTKQEPQLTSFRLTERWEDLAVQFDFLVRESGQTVVHLTAGHPPSGSWCGKALELLGRPESIHGIREHHRKASHKWRAMLQDLQSLAPVKARIETWNFVQRISEAVPGLIAKLNDHRANFESSIKQLGLIVARCSRDVDTNDLIIPPKLGRPYAQQTQLRDESRRQIDRMEKILLQLGSSVARQFANKDIVGIATIPQFHVLPPFPPELEDLICGMIDMAMANQIAELERLFKMPLRGEAWKPSTEIPARPAVPTDEPAAEEPVDTEPEAQAEEETVELPDEQAPSDAHGDLESAAHGQDAFAIEHEEVASEEPQYAEAYEGETEAGFVADMSDGEEVPDDHIEM